MRMTNQMSDRFQFGDNFGDEQQIDQQLYWGVRLCRARKGHPDPRRAGTGGKSPFEEHQFALHESWMTFRLPRAMSEKTIYNYLAKEIELDVNNPFSWQIFCLNIDYAEDITPLEEEDENRNDSNQWDDDYDEYTFD